MFDMFIISLCYDEYISFNKYHQHILREGVNTGIESLTIKMSFKSEYQPSGEGGTRSLPATPHGLHNSIWPPGDRKIVGGVWKGVYP